MKTLKYFLTEEHAPNWTALMKRDLQAKVWTQGKNHYAAIPIIPNVTLVFVRHDSTITVPWWSFSSAGDNTGRTIGYTDYDSGGDYQTPPFYETDASWKWFVDGIRKIRAQHPIDAKAVSKAMYVLGKTYKAVYYKKETDAAAAKSGEAKREKYSWWRDSL